MSLLLRLGAALLGVLAASALCAQTAEQRAQCEREFTPRRGQPGKDVIWVPTPDRLVTAMLRAAKTTKDDVVYDLGAGDGKIAIAAAKEYGARAVGIEYDAKMAKLATCLVAAARLDDKVKIIQGDIFRTDFSEATVVTLYLLPSINVQLIPTLLKMKPGTRVVSHSFLMGDWRPDLHILAEEDSDRAYLWIVPAAAAGAWRLQAPGRGPLTVTLTQQFQDLIGVVIEGEAATPIQDASVRGSDIAFTYVGPKGAVAFKGVVDRDSLTGVVSADGQTARYSGKRN